MKKIFVSILSVTLALALTGCAEVSSPGIRVVGTSEISFNPIVDVATKASTNGPLANGAAFGTDRTVYLSSYFNDEGGSSSQVFFTDIPFTYYNSKWAGGTSSSPNPKYWPQRGTLDFLAFSKEGLAGTISHGLANPAASVTYAMPDNSSIQDDIMAAYAAARPASAHEEVPLVFKHAQAQIAVTAACDLNDATNNFGATVTRVTFRKARYSGTVTATPSGTSSCLFAWSGVSSGTQANVVIGNTSKRLSTTQEQYGKGVLIPAQDASGAASGMDIVVEFTMHNGKKADGTTDDNISETYTYVIPSMSLEAGKRYVFAFTISMNGIIVNAGVSDWIAPAEPYIDIEPAVSSLSWHWYEGGSSAVKQVTVNTNVADWEIQLTGTNASKFYCDYNSSNPNVIDIYPVNPNDGAAISGVTLTVRSTDPSQSSLTKTVALSQTRKPTLTVSPSNLTWSWNLSSPLTQSSTVTITSDEGYTWSAAFTSGSGTFSLVNASGSSGGSVSVSRASSNEDTEHDLTGSVRVTLVGECGSQPAPYADVTLKQNRKVVAPYLDITPAVDNLTWYWYEGNTDNQTITVSSNQTWNATLSGTNADKFAISVSGDVITIHPIGNNDTLTPFTGTLNISVPAQPSLNKTVTLTQTKHPTLNASPSPINFSWDWTSGAETVTVTSDIDWTAALDANGTANFTISGNSGSGNGSITVSPKGQNTDEVNDKTGKIIFTGVGAHNTGITCEVDLRQYKKTQFYLTPSSHEWDWSGGTFQFTVVDNQGLSWVPEVVGTDASVFSASRSGDKVNVTASSNSSYSSKSATLQIKVGTEVKATASLSQVPHPYLSITPLDGTTWAYNETGNKRFQVNTINLDSWTPSIDNTGNFNMSVSGNIVTISPKSTNSGSSARNVRLSVVSDNYSVDGQSDYVDLSQSANAPAQSVSITGGPIWFYANEGGSVDAVNVVVDAGVAWTASLGSTSDFEIVSGYESGTGPGQIRVRCKADNDSGDQYFETLTVYVHGNSANTSVNEHYMVHGLSLDVDTDPIDIQVGQTSQASAALQSRISYDSGSTFEDYGSSSPVSASSVSWAVDSGDESYISINSSGKITGLSAHNYCWITGTYSGATGYAYVNVSSGDVITHDLIVTLDDDEIEVGDYTQARAYYITYTNGTETGRTEVTTSSSCTWTSVTTSVATVSNTSSTRGRVTGASTGTSNIRASFSGESDYATITVVSGDVITHGLEVTLDDDEIEIGDYTQARAYYITYTNGTETSRTEVTTSSSCSWSSGTTSVATVSTSYSTRGRVTGVSAGTSNISASYSGESDYATIRIVSGAVITHGLEVTLDDSEIETGDYTQARAYYITYTNGTETSRTEVTTNSSCSWSSGTTSVATVSNSYSTRGRVTGVSAGTSNISASYSGESDYATITVVSPTVITYGLEVVLDDDEIDVGDYTQARAYYITYTNGVETSRTEVTTSSSCSWSSGTTSVATVSTSYSTRGRVTGVSAGTSSISATYSGKSDNATITVVSGSHTYHAAYVGVVLDENSIDVGDYTSVSAVLYEGTYTGPATSAPTSMWEYSWTSSSTTSNFSSSNTSVATVNNSTKRVTGVAAGSATISSTKTLSGYDYVFAYDNATISVTAVTPPTPTFDHLAFVHNGSEVDDVTLDYYNGWLYDCDIWAIFSDNSHIDVTSSTSVSCPTGFYYSNGQFSTNQERSNKTVTASHPTYGSATLTISSVDALVLGGISPSFENYDTDPSIPSQPANWGVTTRFKVTAYFMYGISGGDASSNNLDITGTASLSGDTGRYRLNVSQSSSWITVSPYQYASNSTYSVTVSYTDKNDTASITVYFQKSSGGASIWWEE